MMKKYLIAIPAKAERSIDEQIDWLFANPGGDGKRLSERWADEFDKVIESLKAHPNRNGFAPENGRLFPDLEIRQKRFRLWEGKPGWRVLHIVDDREAVVTILQIRHERQPWVEV
jgi:plasmid stabilization system protein ParE